MTKKSNPRVPKSHQDVWVAFVAQATSKQIVRHLEGSGHLRGSEGATDSEEALANFVSVAQKSTKPWPDDLLIKMMDFVPQDAQARHSEFMRWVNKANYGHAHALDALRVCFEAGFSPARFIPNSRVSTLGVAAYIAAPSVVQLCYQFCSIEESRLTLQSSHLSANDRYLVGSTLLHRLVERHGTGNKDYTKIVSLILKQDPEACLQQRQDQLYPDGCANNKLASLCREKRALLEKNQLNKVVEGKGSSGIRVPKI